MTLLTLENVSASYGKLQALFDVSLSVTEAEVVALLGRNGMGKSTTVKSVCRMVAAQGALSFNDVDLTRLSSHQTARLGIGLVPEGRRCFTNLNVYENLIAAARPGYWNFEKVVDLFPRLGERENQKAASLSGGEQQMVAIGRALMTNPRLLILDEATEGLAPIIRQEIWAAINRLKSETGLAILVIDKSLSELRTVCDRAVILEGGYSVWHGAIHELGDDLLEKYLGV